MRGTPHVASVLRASVLALGAVAVSAGVSLAQLVGGSSYPVNGTNNPPTSFGTIAQAVTYMGTSGVSGTGQITLELSTGYAGEAAPITIPTVAGLSATLGVTVRPAVGYTALTSVAGAASTPWAIRLTGSYITLDGRAGGTGTSRDWTIRCTGSGASGNGQSAVRLDNSTNSMTDNTVRWCILEAEATSTTSGILAVAGNTTNTLKNTMFDANLIRSTGSATPNVRAFAMILAAASNVGNTGNVVRNNIINQYSQRGINLTGGFPGIKVFGNEIFHTAPVTQPTTAETHGIYFSTTTSQGAEIYNNFIHDLQWTNGVTAVNGIYLFNGATSGAVVRVHDNRVAFGAGTIVSGVGVYGIRDNALTNSLFSIDYNSVYLSGSPAAGAGNSAAYRKEVNSASTVRNNIFYNARSNSGATGTNWGISINSTTNLTLVNNDYFVSGTGGVLGTNTGAAAGNRVTLADWKAVVADAGSISQNPNYLNPTTNPPDLKIDTAIGTQLESGGVVVAGLDNDFEGDIRQGSIGYPGTGSAPDIGADEFAGLAQDLTPPVINYTILGPTTSTTNRAFTGVTVTDVSGVNGTSGTRPRVYYKRSVDANTFNDNSSATDGWKNVEASGSGSPFDFTIDYSRLFGGSAAGGDVIQYFVVAQDLASTPNVAINSGTFASPPTSVNLAASAFPIGGTINSYSIQACFPAARTVGTGGDYATLKAAFDALNGAILCSDVTLTVLASGTTEIAPAVLNPLAYDTGGPFTVTIRPDAGATPTITGSFAGAVVRLNGADHVVLDGSNSGGTTRDLSITNASTAAASGVVWVSSGGTGLGSTDIEIRNCNVSGGVDQSSAATETWGIAALGATLATTSDGIDNDDLTIENNAITRVRWGIYVRGSAANPVDNCVIVENTVGPAAFGSDQIGRGGIVLQNAQGAAVTANEVRCVGELVTQTVNGAADKVGIAIGDAGWTPTGSAVTNSSVSRNYVHDIVDERTFSAVGIIVAGTGTPSNNLVANNMVQGVRANGTSGDQGVGIGVGLGTGDRVVFNSIQLTGDIDPGAATTATQSMAGLRVVSASVTNLTLRNNISAVDVSSNTGTLRHFSIVAPATSYAWGTGGSDYSDYYANPGNSQMALGGIGTSVPYTVVSGLTDWRTQFTPNQDANSLVASPPFLLAPDLHLDTTSPTALESAGSPVAGVTFDFDNAARNATTPDIGADEGAFTPLATLDLAGVTFVDPANAGVKTTGVSFQPTATFANNSSGSQTNVPVRYRIVGPAPAVTEIYNDTQSVPVISGGGGTANQAFTSLSIAVAGTYTMYARSEVPGDVVPGNDEITGMFDVLAPLAGPYNVGTAEAFPFNSLTNAVTRLNQVGVSAAVTFNLTDATYGGGETFPIVINPIAGASGTNTFTLKPAAGNTASISGNVIGAVLRLHGADFVTIDGSNSGGATRDLSITNTSSSGSTAAIWLSSQGSGAGASNNVIRNCQLSCGADQSISTNATFGILSSGALLLESSDGADNDDNTFHNNSIIRVRYGIWIRGLVGNTNDNIAITENLIGPAAFGSTQVGKSGIVIQQVNNGTISGNEVRCVGVLAADAATGTDRVGIGVASNAWTPAGSACTNVSVVGNYVHDIVDEKTFSAVGIVLAGTGTPSLNVVANNMVQGVRANGTSGDQAVGIGLDAGNGDVVAFNSVYMSGDMDPSGATTSTQSSAGLRIATTATLNLTVKNNIVVTDAVSNTASLAHYAIVAPATTFAWGAGGSDNNDLYAAVANAQAVLGGIGTTVPYANVAGLAAWRTQFTPNQDALSLSAAAPFLLAPDLHLDTTIATALESGGAPLAGITTDFDGDGRNATTPDIGADEGAFTAAASSDVAALAFVLPGSGATRGAGIPFSPQASFINNGIGSATNVPVRYRIVGPSPSPAEIYNNLQTLPSLAGSGGSATQTFGTVSIAAPGTYTIFARSELPGDLVPGNDEITGSLLVQAPLAGTYAVGAAEAAPFHSLTTAVARLNQVGVSAAVTFSLVDTLYAAGESFPVTIQPIAGGSPTNTFRLKPAPGVVAAIRGASASAVVVLNGADYVTIDGSNTPSGSSRDLSIQNTTSGATTAVIWGQSVSGDGAASNEVAHCNIIGSGSSSSFIGVGFGGTSIGIASNGADNDGNSIRNCAISRVSYGIYSGGSGTANQNTGTVIEDNVMTAPSPANINKAGIFIRFDNGAQILRNTVSLVSQPSGSAAGIALGTGPVTNILTATAGDDVRNALVDRNRIVSVTSPSGTGFSAVGILVGTSGAGTNTVSNCMISGVSSPATPSDLTAGIYAVTGLGGLRIYHNSVALAGSRAAAEQPSFALAINGNDLAVDVRNNILYNTQTSSSTGNSYAIGLGYGTYANLTCNHNQYFTGGANDRFSIVGGLTNTPAGDRTTLAAWQAETGKDANSFVSDPLFVNVDTDLHLSLAGPAAPPAYGAGTPLAGFTVDLDGETRKNPPDIGADEVFDTVAPTVAVTAPNGGESWIDGSVQSITWTATDLFGVTSVTIEYSIDGGASWLPVAVVVPNSGTHAWTVPNTPSTQARVRVSASDAIPNVGLDVSDLNFTIQSQSGVAESLIPAVTSLEANYPNPFFRSTVIPYGLRADSRVRVDIFDVTGRLVRSLVDRDDTAGLRQITWDGTDGGGGRVASGVYLVRFVADGRVQTRSVRVVR